MYLHVCCLLVEVCHQPPTHFTLEVRNQMEKVLKLGHSMVQIPVCVSVCVGGCTLCTYLYSFKPVSSPGLYPCTESAM